MRYEINEVTKELRVYNSSDDEILYQPHWPNGTEWGSVSEVESWAEQYLLSVSDRSADLPGPSPDKPTVARPTSVQLPPAPPGSED